MSGIRNHCRRRNVVIFCLWVGSAAALAFAADAGADVVFGKVRKGILADIADSQGIACMASVERTRYLSRTAARTSSGPANCAELIAATANTPRGAAEWHDRLRLDVTASPTGEEFALTGASPFEQNDIAGMLRTAATGSGEFSMFLRNLISNEGTLFQSRRVQQTQAGKFSAFSFSMPAVISRSPSASSPTEYRGSLYATPDSNDVKRLTLEMENTGNACRVQYAIDYTTTRIGNRQIILPQSSTMEAVYKDGKELHSETYYSSCHKKGAGDPPVAATAALAPLPPGVRFRVRFQVPINGETAATGDPIVGVIRTTVKDKQKNTIVHAGDRIHGRIAAIEEYLLPQSRWNLAIVFQTIERGVGEHGIDQGIEQPVSLVPLDDGDRAPHDDTPGDAELQKSRPVGGAYFIFHTPHLLLDQKFETEWETR